MRNFARGATLGLLMAAAVPAHAICLWNCSPTDVSGQLAFERYLAKSSGGMAHRIESFKKTNGQDVEMMGRKGYLMDVEAVVVFPQGLNAVCLDKEYGASTYYQKMRNSLDCANLKRGGGLIVGVGERVTVRRQMAFEKTEQGWRGPDGRLYK